MEFRKATIDDIQDLISLRKQQLLDQGMPTYNNIDFELEQYFHSSIKDNTFISWLALENNEIIATSGLCSYKLLPSFSNPSGMVAYITNMFTVKEFRRKGIASQLLERIINEARLLNYSVIRLSASSDGKNLYKKFGFYETEGYMALKFKSS